MAKEIIIVGTGFAGSYIARNLAENGYKVKMIDKRSHIAGNMYDKIDEQTGCLYHVYGPHIFHTDNDNIMEWLKRFSKWTPFESKTRVLMEDKFYNCSFGFHTIKQLYTKDVADTIIQTLLKEYPNRETVSIVELLNSKNKNIKMFADYLWENDYKLYTSKQWGISPEEVDPSVLKRVPIYLKDYDRYFSNKYECLPKEGYTKLFENILDHHNIDLQLNTNALDNITIKDNKVFYNNKEVILLYTGAIDELFEYKYGELSYRSLTFKQEIAKNKQNYKFGTPCVDVYPEHKYEYTRIAQYNKLPIQNHLREYVKVYEYSHTFNKDNKELDRYYPVRKDVDKEIYSKYKEYADSIDNLYLCGRLADYTYYDMDKVLEAADVVFNNILSTLHTQEKGMKVYAVTGASGYIGSQIVKHLLKEDNTLVLAYSRPNSKYKEIFEGNVKYFSYNGKQSSLEEACKADTIFHLGASCNQGSKEEDIEELVDSNILFSSKLFNVLKENKYKGSVVIASTFSSLDEFGEVNPTTYYSASKSAVEVIAKYYKHHFAIHSVSLPDTIGPNDWRPKIHNLLKETKEETFEVRSHKDSEIAILSIYDVYMNMKEVGKIKLKDLYMWDIFAGAPKITLEKLAKQIRPDINIKVNTCGERKFVPKKRVNAQSVTNHKNTTDVNNLIQYMA